MTMLRYKKTLDIVEKFMIDSRIREYCTDICKGTCCNTCYKDNPKACHKHEKRRLSCSIYVCLGMCKHISEKDNRILKRAKIVILKEYHRFSGHNIYFNAPGKKFFRQSRFYSDAIYKLDEDMSKRINIIITKLIRNKIKIKEHRICP